MAKMLNLVKKQNVTVNTGNKILFIVLGMERAGAYLAYELSQIISLSEKKIDVVFADSLNITQNDLKYEKFIQDDVDELCNKADITRQRCSNAFSLNIEAYDKKIKTKEDILNLIRGRMGYFPIIISNYNSAKIKKILCETIKTLNDVVCITADNDKTSGKILFTYKKEGEYITPDYFTEFPDEKLLIEKDTTKSQSKKTNIETSKYLFLYADDILCERPISTYITKFNTTTKQTVSKFIGGDYGVLKEVPENSRSIRIDTGNKDIFVMKIGTGGTGASLAYEITHEASTIDKNIDFIFIDGDIVEPKNLNRQRFIISDLNKYKAEVTAERCVKAYKKDIEVSNEYIISSEDIYNMIRQRPNCFPIILGCSDSLKLRKLICKTIEDMPNIPDMPKDIVYIDAGNDTNSGQIIFTYMKDGKYVTPDFFTEFPYASDQLKSAKLVTEMSCDELMNSAPQTKGANLSAATNMYSYFEDVIEGNPISTYVTHFNIANKQTASKLIEN